VTGAKSLSHNKSVRLGAEYLGNELCRFLVWAPLAAKVEVHLFGPEQRFAAMEQGADGYHLARVGGVAPGSLYKYRLNGGEEYPDPASRFQPEGVHGPSQVVADHFDWKDDAWTGLPLEKLIFYEIHAGAYTPEATFESLIPRLNYLKDLGITALEIMPVAQFPGNRNWGYDGAYPFAVQNSYGGPVRLKRLVDAAHQRGLAVVLDVVYNHLGPEGNYLGQFGYYFTNRYQTPWGQAVNFDGPHSREVRRYVIENALYWLRDFHMDALRLDAVHGIFDNSGKHILQEMAEAAHAEAGRLKRRLYLIAESDLNDSRLVRPPAEHGYGLDAVWSDDFHHALHTLLTGERAGYYEDFGRIEHLAKAYSEGFVYSGQFSSYRGRVHGNSSKDLPGSRFVVCSQNHDQTGNRMLGERLSQLIPFEGLKVAAAAVVLSPFLPLLFMGEEYGETAPFFYFVSHGDPGLIEAVRRGRREEFAAFSWRGEVPDPQSVETFARSRLDPSLREEGEHRMLLEFYRELIRLRNTRPALANLSMDTTEIYAFEEQRTLCVRRWLGEEQILLAFHFGDRNEWITPSLPPGLWRKTLDSAEAGWGGGGSPAAREFRADGSAKLEVAPRSFCLFTLVSEAGR
jgi:maltooligosyltrehalose trehalohydrolase